MAISSQEATVPTTTTMETMLMLTVTVSTKPFGTAVS